MKLKNIFKYIIVIISFLFINLNVEGAECTSSEIAKLQKEAANIKVNYEIVKEIKKDNVYDLEQNKLPQTYEYIENSIKISIYNITKNLFIIQSEKDYTEYDNDVTLNGESNIELKFTNEKSINYKDTINGNYSFSTTKTAHYIDYKFDIYSNTDCDTILLKTITLRKPKYNIYYKEKVCKEYPNTKLCQEFITNDLNINSKEFIDAVKKEAQKANINNKKDNNFLNSYYIYGSLSVIVIAIIIYIVINERRKRI